MKFKEELSASANSTPTRPNPVPPDQDSIDSANKSFTQTLLNAALVSKASKLVKQPKKKMELKPVYKMWFDRECMERKRNYFRFKNQLRRNGCKNQSYREARKFKQFLTKKRKVYHATLNQKLKILRSNNSREYWKILNSCTQGKKLVSQVSNDTFFEHFKSLAAEGVDFVANMADTSSKLNALEEDTSILNNKITTTEALKEISLMKNGKAPGLDDVRNEYLKNLPPPCVSTLVELFNTILDTGIIPTDWSVGVILPLFKKKGVATDPGNYRGITLLSCISKLFTAILNRRLTKFIDKNLGNEQAGFRAKHSTMDHVFVLHHVIDFYRQQGRRLYCAFVDYSKAFDLVNRSALWHKLIQQGVGGKILTVIKNMYLEAKSCIKADGSISNFFDILTGVRQGENLSPTLFAMFLNDFKDFLAQTCKGLEHLGTYMQDLDTFARLYVLLYADDTVLLAESADELQTSLTRLRDYCDLWGLKVNREKTQIVIFSKGRVIKRPVFYLGEEIIDVVDDYTYLGVILNYNGNYLKAMMNQKKSANKAMNALLAKARLLELDIDTTLELFQRCVVPILLYGCEIWGYQTSNTHVLEAFYRKFIKIILKLSNSTPTCMVYGESGQPCITRLINSRLVNFWAKLKFDDTPRLSKALFNTVSTCHGSRMQLGGGANLPSSETRRFNFIWLEHVRRTLSELNLDHVWYTDSSAKYSRIEKLIKKQSNAQFHNKWLYDIANNSQCGVYRLYKRVWGMSNYLALLDAKRRVPITKFLTRNHFLPINANRFRKADEPVKPTTCTLCPDQVTGDELHYLLHCSAFADIRKCCPTLSNEPLTVEQEIDKFGEVFASSDPTFLSKLSKFISKILDTFTPQVEDEPLIELPIRKTHVTRAGRTSVRPRHLKDFFV